MRNQCCALEEFVVVTGACLCKGCYVLASFWLQTPLQHLVSDSMKLLQSGADATKDKPDD